MCGGRGPPAGRASWPGVLLRGVEWVVGSQRRRRPKRSWWRGARRFAWVMRGNPEVWVGLGLGARPACQPVINGRLPWVSGISVGLVVGWRWARPRGWQSFRAATRTWRSAGGSWASRRRCARGPRGSVPVLEVMCGRLSARGRAATAAGPPASGASPGRSAARSPGWRATA